MGKIKEFQIRLATNKTVYCPGEMITGDVLVRLESPSQNNGIKIKFYGQAFVHWTEQQERGSGDNRHTVTVHYSGIQVYFNHSVYVFGRKGEKQSLSQGEHVYPFHFQLPENLPTSYEDHMGHIRYEIRANIKKPWKIDPKARRVFTVLETVDLNNFPNAMMPAIGTETKHLCCLCCKSGPIKAEFQADRSAYVPGEFVTINATLKNKSNSKVKATSASLMQKVTYHATQKSRSRWIKICGLEGKECSKKKTISWTNEKLQIPPVPPTLKGTCKVLDIEYHLMFQGHLRTCAVDLREFEEITIGTVPISELYQNMADQQSSGQESGFQAPLPSAVVDNQAYQSPAEPTIVPPRAIYKEVGGGAINLAAEDDDGKAMAETTYVPQYTFYDWSQSAFTY